MEYPGVHSSTFQYLGPTRYYPDTKFSTAVLKVRVFGLKTLFLKRFTVRSTTRTLIIDKTDHSAFTHYFILVTPKFENLGHHPAPSRNNSVEGLVGFFRARRARAAAPPQLYGLYTQP